MTPIDEKTIAGLVSDKQLGERVAGKRVIVLGADGFLGCYTALALQRLGADVSLYSRREHPILADRGMKCHHGDLLTTPVLEAALQDREIIFDLAGSSGGVESNRNAAENLSKECAPHLNLFQIASKLANRPLVIFCSSRTVYGKPAYLPVDEGHPLVPQSIYAVHKKTLEDYLHVFKQLHGLPYVIFRLSNPYGPFPWQLGKAYGILNQFILKAAKGEPLPIFGDGSQLRDYIFIEDAVGAFIRAAVTPACHSQTFNLGGPDSISMISAADRIVEKCPQSSIEFKEWPSDYSSIESGDYVTDCRKLESALDWKPGVSFPVGLSRTLASYAISRNESPGRSQPEVSGANSFSQWKGKRVLVTGAGGSLGSFMCHVLLGMGAKVTALYRSALPEKLEQHADLNSVCLDLGNPGADIEKIFIDVAPQVVFHFAAAPDGRENPDLIEERMKVNTLATLKMLQAAQLCSIEAFIVGDSCKVFGNSPVPHRENTEVSPDSSYAASKHAAWALCKIFHRNHNLPVAALRPTIIYGPGQAYNLFSFLAKCIRENRTVIELDGGQQTRDPLFIADAVNAYLLAAENIGEISGRALPIGGGLEIPVSELSQQFVDCSEKQVEVRCCNQKMRSGEILRSMCDNIEARTFIHWVPNVSLQDGLAITARYLLSPIEIQRSMEEHWHQQAVDQSFYPRLNPAFQKTGR